MAGKLCSECAHTVSWHKLVVGVRRHCTFPKCACPQYEGEGNNGNQASTEPVSAKIANFRPSFEVANKPLEFMQQVGATPQNKEFMLSMAAKVLAQHRLNKLSEQGVITLAELGPNWCSTCREMVRAANNPRSWGDSLIGTWAYTQFTFHLSIKHIADIFHVEQDVLHGRALAYIEEHTGQGDSPDSDDQLGIVTGWRTWNLERGPQGLRLVPPHGHKLDAPVIWREVQASHYGDRELCLQHLTVPRSSTRVNVTDLTVTVTRSKAPCQCGLYCWLSFEDFCKQQYRDFAGVTANVIPYGTVGVGADSRSLRASDMMISRLMVYLGRTELNGLAFDVGELVTYGMVTQDALGKTAWGRYAPQLDEITLEAYRGISQELASQFEVVVELVDCKGLTPHEATEPKVVETFYPQQLPDWMRAGLVRSKEE